MMEVLSINIIFRSKESMFKYTNQFIINLEVNSIKINASTSTYLDKIDDIIDDAKQKKIFLLCFIDQKTIPFLEKLKGDGDYVTVKLNITIFLLDLSARIYQNANDRSIFYECYYFASYYPKIDTTLNNALTNTVNKYKGTAENLLDDVSMGLYNGLLFLKAAILNNADISNPLSIRSYLYTYSVKTPVGDLILDKSNYVNIYPYLLQYNENSQDLISRIISPVTPQPFYYLVLFIICQLNNNKFLTSDYSISPGSEKIEYTKIGIAYILDLNDLNYKKSFIDFNLAINKIEEYNSEAGTARRVVRYELYNCPKSSDAASGLLVKLKTRGYDYIIGGCDPSTKSLLADVISSINMIFLYTGLNTGGECLENMYIYYIQNIYLNNSIPRCLSNSSQNFKCWNKQSFNNV